MNTITLKLSALTPSAMHELWEGLDGDEYAPVREALAAEYEANMCSSIEEHTHMSFWSALQVVADHIKSGNYPDEWAQWLIQQTNYDTASDMVEAVRAEITDNSSFACLLSIMFARIEEPLNTDWKTTAVSFSEWSTPEELQGLYRFAVLCTKLKG